MRLIEPLGLLAGPDAEHAVRAGVARRLAGGPLAFTLARLIDGVVDPRIVSVPDLPAEWQALADRVAAPIAGWAGLDPCRPAVMGILNVTPDSFSDGGAHADADAAVAAGLALAAEGADIVDIGGESMRPGAAPVSPACEQGRVLQVIRGLAERGVRVSIDTRHASTMAAALEAGATIVNDVSGLSHDPDAASLVARAGCPVVLMYMRGEPATMARHAVYDDVAVEVAAELAARVQAAERAGIALDRMVIDPGIGFAKTARHNLEVLSRLPLLCNIGCRILVGVSRKSFIGRLTGAERPRERDAGSLALGLHAVARAASILRVHDVAATVQALRVREAVLA